MESYLRGKRYTNEKKRRGAPDNNKNSKKQIGDNRLFERGSSTRIILAEEYNISDNTIQRDEKVAIALDAMKPEEKQEIFLS